MTTPPVQDDPNPDDPNPARSSATLAAFVEQVQRRLGLEAESEAEVLVRASDTAEVLVIGSRGRGGFAGLLLGSTSQSVLPYSQCPTMVVRVSRDPDKRREDGEIPEPGL